MTLLTRRDDLAEFGHSAASARFHCFDVKIGFACVLDLERVSEDLLLVLLPEIVARFLNNNSGMVFLLRPNHGDKNKADKHAFSKDAGLSHVFTTSTAMVSPEVTIMFVNLFKKFGFVEAGPCLVLEL